MKGQLKIFKRSKEIISTPNTLTQAGGLLAMETLSGLRDRRAILVRFGDSSLESSYKMTDLVGTFLYSTNTSSIEKVSWKKTKVNFEISPTELQIDRVREVGLFSTDSAYMWARAALPRTIKSGSATVTFQWTFTFSGF